MNLVVSQPAFTCSKLTIETLEEKYSKLTFKANRATPATFNCSKSTIETLVKGVKHVHS